MAAAKSPGVAFVVMMAGMGIPGPEMMKQQGIDIVRASGGSEAQIARQVETQGSCSPSFVSRLRLRKNGSGLARF